MTSEMEKWLVSNVYHVFCTVICRLRGKIYQQFFFLALFKMFCTNYKSLGFSSIYLKHRNIF